MEEARAAVRSTPAAPGGPDNDVTGLRVAVIGLGYVGLQLAVAFGRQLATLGFDISPQRVLDLVSGTDHTGELTRGELESAYLLRLSAEAGDLRGADVYLIAVPTPVDSSKRPDLGPLLGASELVGRALAAGPRAPRRRPPIVVYESTVYPGCTEEICLPALERASGLSAGEGFTIGYSPERINPGDAMHALPHVVKVVAGQDDATAARLEQLYGLVVGAGVYRAPDIRTAEAAKVIENIQRDLNIALMNELAVLFHRLGIDTGEVLRAARTKWNFLPFDPGLVGGHCIPVDPYYLTHKAQEAGYFPEVILAGRRMNDSMGAYVARETIRLLIRAGRLVRGARILVLGATFKENVRDLRNTRVVDLVCELTGHGIAVSVHDPLVGDAELAGLGLPVAPDPFASARRYDGVILAVPHAALRNRSPEEFRSLLDVGPRPGVFVDVKGVAGGVVGDGILYWRL